MKVKSYEVDKEGPPKLPLLPKAECIRHLKSTNAKKFMIHLSPRKQIFYQSRQSTSVVPLPVKEDNGVPLFLLEPLLANVKLLDESHFLFDTPKSNPSHLLYGVLSSPADCIPAMLPMLPAVGDVEPICIPTLKPRIRSRVNARKMS